MLLIATVLSVVGAALYRRSARTAVLQSLKQRVFGAASARTWIHKENR